MQIMMSRRVSRRSIWIRRLAIIAVIAVGIGAWIAYEPVASRYRNWKQQRALVQARQFLDKKDLPNAKLALDVAIATPTGNPEVLRVAADLLEMAGSPQALQLRRQLLFQSPGSVPDRLAMANAAVRARDFNAARDALAGFTPAQLGQPEVLRAHLSYALAVNNRPMADALFDRLASIAAPDDEMKAMHALLLRQHPDAEKSAAARKELETLAQNPKFALTLNRAFFTEALATRDNAAAKRFAALVSSHPAATFTDRLNEANLLLLVDKQPFESVSAPLAKAAAATGASAAEYSHWLLVQGKSTETDRWLAGLPPAIAGTPEVRAVQAEVAAAAKDWDRFGRAIEGGAWGTIAPEVVGLAMSAQTIGARNPALRKQVWNEALTAAGTEMRALRVLLRMASTWQWEDEIESTILTIVRVDPTQTWAHSTLMGVYQRRGDGRKMLEVMTILKNAAPTSPTYRHDWALLTLLVSPVTNWDPPKVLAKEIHLSNPANPNFATTYALALAQAGKVEEARTVLEKLSVADREFPLRAPYLAFVYGSSRRRVEFDKYAGLVGNATILQQERNLIQLGSEALNRPLVPPSERKTNPAPKVAPKK